MPIQFRLIFVLGVLWCFPSYAARAASCAQAMQATPFHQLVGQIVKSELDQHVEYVLRASTTDDAAKKLSSLAVCLRAYHVEIEVRDEFRKHGHSYVDFSVAGLGREVAQALLEFANPQTSGELAQTPLVWLK